MAQRASKVIDQDAQATLNNFAVHFESNVERSRALMMQEDKCPCHSNSPYETKVES